MWDRAANISLDLEYPRHGVSHGPLHSRVVRLLVRSTRPINLHGLPYIMHTELWPATKRRPGRPRLGSDPTRAGKSQLLMARVPDELVEIVDQVGREQGARGRSEALRKALELLRELKKQEP